MMTRRGQCSACNLGTNSLSRCRVSLLDCIHERIDAQKSPEFLIHGGLRCLVLGMRVNHVPATIEKCAAGRRQTLHPSTRRSRDHEKGELRAPVGRRGKQQPKLRREGALRSETRASRTQEQNRGAGDRCRECLGDEDRRLERNSRSREGKVTGCS